MHPPRLTIVVLDSLPPGASDAQVAHVSFAMAAEHPKVVQRWMANGNTILIRCASAAELSRLREYAEMGAVPCSEFCEPALGGARTAIALGPTGEHLARHLPRVHATR